MATDPTEKIREKDYEWPLTLSLHETLERLAQLEPSPEAPYLTVTLDWRPEGQDPRRRLSEQFLSEEGEKLLEQHHLRTPAHQSFAADLKRVKEYLEDEIDPSAHGVAFVTCHAKGIFEAMPLGIPVENRVITGPIPALATLSKLAEDFTTYAVLLADQHDAILTFISQSRANRNVSLHSNDYPRKQQQGGWSQRRYQMRADERVRAFADDIAEEIRKELEERRVEALVLAGDEIITSELKNQLHPSVQDLIVGSIRMDIRASESEIAELSWPVVIEAERQREMEAVQRVQDNKGPGGLAVVGPEDVLVALQSGQVMTLVMTDDFHGEGWADYTLPVYGVGSIPREHPAGGDPQQIVPVHLEDEMVRLALRTDADIEIVSSYVPAEFNADDQVPDAGSDIPRSDAARSLDEVGDVGAILRFTLDTEQSTAEM